MYCKCKGEQCWDDNTTDASAIRATSSSPLCAVYATVFFRSQLAKDGRFSPYPILERERLTVIGAAHVLLIKYSQPQHPQVFHRTTAFSASVGEVEPSLSAFTFLSLLSRSLYTSCEDRLLGALDDRQLLFLHIQNPLECLDGVLFTVRVERSILWGAKRRSSVRQNAVASGKGSARRAMGVSLLRLVSQSLTASPPSTSS
jgi:hypothetical protein